MHDFRISRKFYYRFTNGVNGRIDNKTWCKCECCAPMGTSIGVCCLEIPEICKPRFSSASGLNVCRSDPYFVIWFLGKKTSLVLWFQPSVNPWQIRIKVLLHFTLLLKQIFFFIKDAFCERIFSKKHSIGFMGSVIIESIYYHLNQRS